MAWTTFDADTGSTGTNPVDNATWNGGFNSTGASTSVVAAPNSIVLRDINGLSQVGTPLANQDIANKAYVDLLNPYLTTPSSSAVANTLALRDSSARSQFNDASGANPGYVVTSAQTAANTSGLLGSTNVNTASTIMARDSNSRAQVSAPSAGLDIANKTYVDTVGTTSTPVGSVALFAGPIGVPSGWLACTGQAVSRTTYSTLYSILVPTLGTVTSITIAAPTVLTVIAHGLSSGDSIYLTTTGALPTGLTANILYYVTVLTVDTFNVSTTYANYIAGTKVAATVAGSGVQTAWRCAFGLGDGSTTFNVPDLRLTAQGIPNATASITAWTTYSLTIGAVTTAPTKGTVTTDLAQWRRIGQQMEWAYDYVQTALGSAGSGTYLFPLPSGYSIDLTRFPANTIVGVANMSNAADEIAASSDQGSVYVYDANNLAVKYVSPTSATEVLTYVGSTLFPLSTAIIRYRFKASVLIAQFTTNNNLLTYNIKS